MVGQLFPSLLEELGKELEIKNLEPGDNDSCIISFPSGIEIQIEPYQKGDFLLLCVDIGEVPPGRYREDVFREALKANGMPYPRHGIFAYSEQSDHMLIFELISLHELNGVRIASVLIPLKEKAEKWKEALDSGVVPLAYVASTTSAAGSGGIFGLQP